MPSEKKTIMQATWREVTQPDNAPKARSSHAVAVVGQQVYVFGGEFEPRVPIDNSVHVFDLQSRKWAVAEASGEAPRPRVGVTMAAVHKVLYVFAGRDQEHEEMNELYSFDTEIGVWKLLSSGDRSPPHRSYHSFVADEQAQRLYTFGGCGKNGRLNDLWMYDVRAEAWSELPSASPSLLLPRGGPGLAVVDGSVWVIFGFNGKELADIHCFDVEKKSWTEVQTVGQNPTGRSVFGCYVFGKHIILYGGEVDPSDLGHLGAGAFSSEVLALNTSNCEWTRPEVAFQQGSDPGARGWYAAATCGPDSMLVSGGNTDSNDRLEDMYILSIRVAD